MFYLKCNIPKYIIISKNIKINNFDFLYKKNI